MDWGLPSFMDERQFRATPLVTLTTREGHLDVLDFHRDAAGGFGAGVGNAS